MLFTIAIPTFNNECTIARAVSSAINQKYDSVFEILVVNNASTDKTGEILSSYTDSRIRVVTNPKTVGMYENHNICLNEAQGDYIIFCHSDDYLTENCLFLVEERLKLRGYPTKYILWGRSMYRDYYESIGRSNYQLNSVISGIFAVDCFVSGGLTPSGTCYSRKSLVSIGGYPQISNSLVPADWFIMLLSVFNHFEFEMIDRLLFVREFASTATFSALDERYINSNREFFESLKNSLSTSQFMYVINRMIAINLFSTFPYIKKYLSLRTRIHCILKLLPKYCLKPRCVKYILSSF